MNRMNITNQNDVWCSVQSVCVYAGIDYQRPEATKQVPWVI